MRKIRFIIMLSLTLALLFGCAFYAFKHGLPSPSEVLGYHRPELGEFERACEELEKSYPNWEVMEAGRLSQQVVFVVHITPSDEETPLKGEASDYVDQDFVRGIEMLWRAASDYFLPVGPEDWEIGTVTVFFLKPAEAQTWEGEAVTIRMMDMVISMTQWDVESYFEEPARDDEALIMERWDSLGFVKSAWVPYSGIEWGFIRKIAILGMGVPPEAFPKE
jgi:hypothetical protein